MRYAEMKNTGIQFVGDIPKHWEYRALKTIASCNDEVLPENTAPDYSFDYIDIGSVHTNKGILGCEHIKFKDAPSRARRIVRKNDVIVSTVRTYLKAIAWIGYYEIPHVVSTGFAVIRAKTVDSVFLHYALLSDNFVSQVEANSVGISYPAINANQLMSLKIPIPPLEEQEAIAAYLDEKCGAIDEIIAEAKATIEEYKAWKTSVIFEAVTKGLDPNAEMKDSGVGWIGLIPKHWKAVALKRLYDYSSGAAVRVGPFGSALSTADYTNSGVLVYNQRVVLDKDFEQNSVFISEKKSKELISFSVFPGDILITTRGSIGKIMIVPPNAPKGVLHPCIIRFRINPDKYLYRLLEYIFNDTDLIKNQIQYYSNSTTIDVLYSYTLKEIRIPLIPMSEQVLILDHLDKQCAAIDGIIAEKQALIDDLETYKKSLIYETVTGKRSVC